MLTQDDLILFMKKTNELAKKAINAGEMPIAALIVYDKKIISSSFAMDKSEKRRMVHADFLALEQADKIKPFPGKRSEMSLFVNLEPCFMCLGSALVFGVGNVYFSLESPIDGATKYASAYYDQLNNTLGYSRPSIHAGLQRDETIKLFEDYYNTSDDNNYKKWVHSLLNSINNHL